MSILTQNETRLLAFLHMRADAGLQEISRATGLKPYTIQYSLRRLRERDLIQFSPVIDVTCLGLFHFGVFMSTRGTGADRLVSYLCESEEVSFVARFGGDYQLGFSICARNIVEVSRFLDKLSVRFNDAIFERLLAVRTELCDYPIKHLFGNAHRHRPLEWGGAERLIQLDQLDHEILSALPTIDTFSKAELARRISAPASSVDFRLRRLERQGVIKGYRFLIPLERFRVLPYCLFVLARQVDKTVRKRVRKFARFHQNVRFLVENLGAWEWEFGVEVTDQGEISRIIQNLYDQFGANIVSIKAQPVLSYEKVSNYPFKSYDLVAKAT